MIVSSRTGLTNVPDGTIITWLRIPGDSTSEAVAFVRHEDDYDTPTAHGGAVRTTWVSPGGWAPQSPEDAGVTYPCVAHTELDPAEPEILAEANPRRDALFAAALVYQGNGTEASADWLAGQVTALADGLAEWLIPTPPEMKACIELPFSDETPPCGDTNCLSNCAYCVSVLDRQHLNKSAIDGVVAEFKARLAGQGWMPTRLNMAGDQLQVILTESLGGGQ